MERLPVGEGITYRLYDINILYRRPCVHTLSSALRNLYLPSISSSFRSKGMQFRHGSFPQVGLSHRKQKPRLVPLPGRMMDTPLQWGQVKVSYSFTSPQSPVMMA